MKRQLVRISTCLVLAAALLAGCAQKRGASPADRELSAKHQLIAQDVSRTDELCRSDCLLALRHHMQRSSGAAGTTDNVLPELERLRSEHGQIQKLLLFRTERANQPAAQAGTLPESLSGRVQPAIEQARQTALAGREYQSALIDTETGPFFVTGVPSADKRAALVSVTKENILREVAAHQQKNLRAIPYPVGGNWRIESVDSRTLQKVDVTHPKGNEGTSHYHKNEVVVRFANPPTEAQLDQIKREIKTKSVRKLGYTYVFTADGMEAKQLMGYFQKWHVLYTEPHYLYLTNETAPPDTFAVPADEKPNDRLYQKYQWNLPIIDTENGWRIARGSRDVKVAVVDTGVDLTHPDLQGRLAEGYNVVNPDAKPQDDVGHGTHVSGVISALTNNGIGVAGMTWYNPIMPVKVLDETGAGSTYAVAEGIIWAADHGAKVINLSLGNYADAEFLHDAIRYAFDKDVLMVSASGNDNSDRPGYPAAYEEVFAVAAIDDKRNKAPFSNYGDYIDVAAPGVSIASTFTGGRYAALSGTSMASPHVAAVAALIRSANPSLKHTEVMDIMRRSAIDLGAPGKDVYFGYGQIDVVNALKMAVPGGAGEPAAVANTAAAPPNWFKRLLDLFR